MKVRFTRKSLRPKLDELLDQRILYDNHSICLNNELSKKVYVKNHDLDDSENN
jgi:hypothetical protein